MEENKCCANCFYAESIFGSKDVICSKKGIVSGGGICKKYDYNIFRKPPKKNRQVKQYSKEKFTL